MSKADPEQTPDYAALYPDGIAFPGLTSRQIITIDTMSRQIVNARGGPLLAITDLPPSAVLEECKSAFLAGTVPPLEQPPENAAPRTRDLLGEPATLSPAAFAQLGTDSGSNHALPQTPDVCHLEPPSCEETGTDFITDPMLIHDPGLGTPGEVQQVTNPAVPSPKSFLRELFQDPESDLSSPATTSETPVTKHVQAEGSPRTWAQVVRGETLSAPCAKPKKTPHTVHTTRLATIPPAPTVTPAPQTTQATVAPPSEGTGRNCPTRDADIASRSSALGPPAGSQNLRGPIERENVQGGAIVLALPQSAPTAPVQALTLHTLAFFEPIVQSEINPVAGRNRGLQPDQPTELTQPSEHVSLVTDPIQPAQPTTLPTGRPIGVGGYPGSLNPIEGQSFAQKHLDPRIRTFAPEGGLERLNASMHAVSMEEHRRGRSASPPSVDLSAPSTGSLNLRTGLDSLNEFNENYGHHVKGAIREARSIPGAARRLPNSSGAPGSLGPNTTYTAASAVVSCTEKSVAPEQTVPARLLLDTELYGTTTTYANGQKLWKCKTCVDCPPLMADNNPGRALIAKHIKGHLKREQHNQIRRPMGPLQAPGQPAQHVQHSAQIMSPQDYQSLAERGLVAAVGTDVYRKPSPFPPSGEQFGWPEAQHPAVGPMLRAQGPEAPQFRTEQNQFFGSQLEVKLHPHDEKPFATRTVYANRQSRQFGQQVYTQGHPSRMHDNQQPGQLTQQGSHFGQPYSHPSVSNFGAPRQDKQMSELPMPNLVSEFNRAGYTSVQSAGFTNIDRAATEGLTTQMNHAWGLNMNWQVTEVNEAPGQILNWQTMQANDGRGQNMNWQSTPAHHGLGQNMNWKNMQANQGRGQYMDRHSAPADPGPSQNMNWHSMQGNQGPGRNMNWQSTESNHARGQNMNWQGTQGNQASGENINYQTTPVHRQNTNRQNAPVNQGWDQHTNWQGRQGNEAGCQNMNWQSPLTPARQALPWLLNTAAPGVSDRGSPPKPNVGAGIVGHFHSGGYGAALSPGPVPYTGSPLSTPQQHTPRPPEQYISTSNANPSPQLAFGEIAGPMFPEMHYTANNQQFDPVGGFCPPIAPTAANLAPPIYPAAAAFGQQLYPGEFHTGNPMTAVLSSEEEQQLVNEFLQGTYASTAGSST